MEFTKLERELTRVRCHCTGEVVRLCSQQKVPVALLRSQCRGATRVQRQERPHLKAADGAAVVLEGHHAVVLGPRLTPTRREEQHSGKGMQKSAARHRHTEQYKTHSAMSWADRPQQQLKACRTPKAVPLAIPTAHT